MAEQSKVRRPAMMMHRTHFIAGQTFPSPETDACTDTDSNLHRHPHVSCSSKSNAVSSLFLSHFSYTPPPPEPTTVLTPKKKAAAALRGLGCTAGAAKQVSVPAVIRSAAEWEGKKVKKKKNPHHQNRKRESFKLSSESAVGESSNSESSCLTMPDVWYGAGIGFSADTTVGSVASSATRKNAGLINGRGKIDGEKIMNPREREKERPSCPHRRTAETVLLPEAECVFLTSHPEPDVFRTRHVRHPSPGGLAEILIQNRFIMGGRSDRFSNWRLNIDHMTYEQLLELGDKIGYVNTGLKEKDLERCVQKVKLSVMSKLAVRSLISGDEKCSVCQEECEGDDELGLLKCGHGFHIQCINQWLAQKNACPVCKTEPVARG